MKEEGGSNTEVEKEEKGCLDKRGKWEGFRQ